jgi:hypothetical protein
MDIVLQVICIIVGRDVSLAQKLRVMVFEVWELLAFRILQYAMCK